MPLARQGDVLSLRSTFGSRLVGPSPDPRIECYPHPNGQLQYEGRLKSGKQDEHGRISGAP